MYLRSTPPEPAVRGNAPASPESREWWRPRRTPEEIAGLLERVLAEKRELERRLSEATAQAESGDGRGRLQAEIAAQKRLMRDELEKRVQALQMEWKRERKRLSGEIAELQKELETYRLTDHAQGFQVL